jgi:hypothetical protein
MKFSTGSGWRRWAGVAAFAGVALVTGCAIKTAVVAVPTGTRITTIYVENNPKVLMDGLLPEILAQVRAQGFQAVAYDGPRPAGAVDYLTFTANWRWHWAMYLTFFRATLYRDGRILGTVEYNARRAGLNPDKYGHTADKIRPLLRQLLQPAAAPTVAAPPVAAAVGAR